MEKGKVSSKVMFLFLFHICNAMLFSILPYTQLLYMYILKTNQNEIVLTCYRNAVRNANTPIGHNIAFLRDSLGIDIDNNEITPDISLPTVYFTNEQRVLLSNLKLHATVKSTSYIWRLYFTLFIIL